MEHTYRQRFGAHLRYTISPDRKFLRIEGSYFGDRWIDVFPLVEYSPICRINTSNGWDAQLKLLLCGAVMLMFFFVGLSSFFSAPENSSNEGGFLMLAGAFIFGLCVIYQLLAFLNTRNSGVIFQGTLRNGSFSVFFPYWANPETDPFIRELRRAIAECFLQHRPALVAPETAAQLRKEYEKLRDEGALTEEELEQIFRKLFGGSPPRQNIGFQVS